jgi:hypothetical protein
MDSLNRRACLAGTAAAAAVGGPALGAEPGSGALSNRGHFSARPEYRDALIDCFTKVLGCAGPRRLPVPGSAEPILAFSFPGGGSISVEITADALDPMAMRKGAWLEIRAADPRPLREAVTAAGLERVAYPATGGFYFAAPGGQVFGVAGPGQL